MSDFKVYADLADIEIDVKKVIDDNMSLDDQYQLVSELFDGIKLEDKPQLLGELFSSLTEQGQNEVLNDIVSQQLSDEQFHAMTEYFKTYGK